MKTSLKNQWILVTGASRGLGKFLAIEFARAGANVILSGRDAALLDELDFDRSLPREVDAAALAAHMKAPENAAMLRATARDISDGDVESLADAVLATTTHPSEAA